MFSNSMCKILHISKHFLKFDGVITMMRVATHNGFIYKHIAVFQKKAVTFADDRTKKEIDTIMTNEKESKKYIMQECQDESIKCVEQ